MGHNMVEEELGSNLSSIVKGGHGFGPLGEVIYCNNNILVANARGGATLHEVDAPFAKWASRNDRV